MAFATIKTEVKYKVTPPIPAKYEEIREDVVTLKLDQEEAGVIRNLIGNMGGPHDSPIRVAGARVYNALVSAGVATFGKLAKPPYASL